MSIPISGVNYRARKSEVRSRKSEVKTQGREQRAESKEVRSQTTAHELPAIEPENIPLNISNPPGDILKTHGYHSGKLDENQDAMKNRQHTKNFIPDALTIVQEGLKSMQAIQMQTAQTHQKFLETQAQAARTLQNMMENTQRLAAASMGIKPETTSSESPPLNGWKYSLPLNNRFPTSPPSLPKSWEA